MSKRLFTVFVALFVLSACKEGGNDALNRRRAELFGKATPITPAPTSRPTSPPAQQAGEDVKTAVGAGSNGAPSYGDATTQFVIAAALIVLGIPTAWTLSLRKAGVKHE